jgi:hypothetical protein
MVEARLIELSRYGDTLEAAVLAEVRRLLREARTDPARRNAAHAEGVERRIEDIGA